MVVAEDVNNIDRSFGCFVRVLLKKEKKKERKNGENFFGFIFTCTIIVSFIFTREEE